MSDQLPPLPEELRFLREVTPPAPPPGFEAAVAARLATTLPAVAASLSTAKLVGGGLALLLTGVGAGVAIDRFVFPPAPREVRVEVPVPVEVLREVVREVPVPVEAPAPAVTPKTARVDEKPIVSSRDVSLAAERKLLEVARSALARGETSAALTALQQHEREFAQGRLSEERDALFIKALHTAGRHDEAAARALKFDADFPDSLLAP